MNNQAYNLGLRQVGRDVVIWPMAKLVQTDVISIGDSVIVDDFVFVMGGKETRIGSFVHIASFASITGGGEFLMEDFAGLGSVHVHTGSEDFSGACLTNPAVPPPYRRPVRSFVHIRKHAIVCASVVILPGVEIGEGAVVGANSLVTRDCEPWTVYVGSPAKPIKSRPKARILELEQQLRSELFDAEGNYIPSAAREQGVTMPPGGGTDRHTR